ncbi:polyphenol oxidase family protein [Actinomycetota bacterium]
MFYWRDQTPGFELAFTDRHDGVSTGPLASLNLGARVGDDPDRVAENRGRVADALGLPRERLLFMAQCHSAEVRVVEEPWGPGDEPAVDAVVTAAPDLGLAAVVADCTPVLLRDATAGVIAAAHAGRPGMVARIVDRTLEAMRDLGARDIEATVGPSVCGRCYEVPDQMRAEAAEVAPESSARSWTGTPAIDVASGVVAQLHGHGVAVTWVPGCSRESADLFSYRGDKAAGRYAGVIVRRPTS